MDSVLPLYLKLMVVMSDKIIDVNPLSTNFTKWSNILNQFVGYLPTNCLSVFGHLVGLALKGLSLSNFKVVIFPEKYFHTKISGKQEISRPFFKTRGFQSNSYLTRVSYFCDITTDSYMLKVNNTNIRLIWLT